MQKLSSVKVDTHLIEEAMQLTGITKSHRTIVEEALKTLVRLRKQEQLIRESRGKFRWEGNLNEWNYGA
jgi:Arc/MetJ family transcription regulator